jgi:hypothetical protein
MSLVHNDSWKDSFRRMARALERIADALEHQNEREQARAITAVTPQRGAYIPPVPPAITTGPRAIGTGRS